MAPSSTKKKRLAGRLIGAVLLLLPILLYYAVFLAFEPNNYFGLRSDTPSGAVFYAIRQYEKAPVNSIIVGDSRVAHLDMAEVERVSGRKFANLSFGGASMKETNDLLQWHLERYPNIDEVVYSLSFYTLNANYSNDRFDTIETALHNPFAYLTSLSYNLLTLDRLNVWLQGQPLDGGASETEDPNSYVWEEYVSQTTGESQLLRTRIIQYLTDIAPYTRNWEPNTEELQRLLNLVEECSERGIRFTIVLPPVHDAIFQYEVEETGIGQAMLPLLEALQQSDALVLDYELTNRPFFREDQFFDGFHLDYERGRPAFTELLFSDINSAWEERSHGS